MNGLSSLRSHRRTASSGERLKESSLLLKDSSLSLKETSHSLTDSQKDSLDGSSHSHISSSHSHRNTSHSHRLSAYDNVTATPSSLSMPGDTTSSWMSCEISLAESAGSEAATLNSGTVSGSGQERPSEAGDSDALDLCVSSTGCSETDLGDDIKGQGSEMTQGLTSLVSELREELRRQRITYEGRIRKLAESCSTFQVQSDRLEEELDQERKRFRMLEIRLRNSERARQDAENRNILLQKEMEEFFTTLGDLTTGAPRTS